MSTPAIRERDLSWRELAKVILTPDERKRVRNAGLLLALGSVMEAIGLAAIYPFVNAIVSETSSLAAKPGALPIFGDVDPTTAGIFLLVFYLLKDAYVAVVTFHVQRVIAGIRTGVTDRTFTRFMREPFAEHSMRDLAEVQRTIQLDAALLVAQALLQGLQLFADVLVVGLVLAVLASIQPLVTLIMIVGSGLVFVFWHLAVRARLQSYGQDAQAARRSLIGSIVSGLRSFKEARVLGAEGHFEGRVHDAVVKFGRAEQFNGAIGELPRLIMEVLMISALVIFGLQAVSGGQITSNEVAMIGVFAAAALRVVPSLSRITRSTTTLGYVRPGLIQLSEALGGPDRGAENIEVPEGYDAVELSGVRVLYQGASAPAIDAVTTRLERGELVSVVGPSGSGKTTLMDVILGLLQPSAGSVSWLPSNGSEAKEDTAVLAYVPQTPYIESGSVRENLGLGLPAEQCSDDRFWEALEAVGLADEIRAKPGGLDHHVGEAGSRISGGQRQRLALARSLARGAHFIVLDEPTAALDAESAATVMDACGNLGPDTTVIVVTHDPEVAKRTDRSIELRAGLIVSERRADAAADDAHVHAQVQPAAVSPGWYPHPTAPGWEAYWTGVGWGSGTRPAEIAPPAPAAHRHQR